LGGFVLNQTQKLALSNRVELPIDDEMLDSIQKTTKQYLNLNGYHSISKEGSGTLIARAIVANEG
jgi:hypothetical protein